MVNSAGRQPCHRFFFHERSKELRAFALRKTIFLDPISFVCVQKKRCRTAKENTLKGYVKIFCSSATDGRIPFGKTLPFYFRCRWSGGDLRYSRSSAPPHLRRSTMQALTDSPEIFNNHHWSGSDKQRL